MIKQHCPEFEQEFLDALGTALMATDGDDVAEMLWQKLGWEPHAREKHDYSGWDESSEFFQCFIPKTIGMNRVYLCVCMCIYVCVVFLMCLSMFNPPFQKWD